MQCIVEFGHSINSAFVHGPRINTELFIEMAGLGPSEYLHLQASVHQCGIKIHEA
jgi:hypothetical protein